MKSTTGSNCKYLFNWLNGCIGNADVDQKALIAEVVKVLDKLVRKMVLTYQIGWDKKKVREIFSRLPNLGANFIGALE